MPASTTRLLASRARTAHFAFALAIPIVDHASSGASTESVMPLSRQKIVGRLPRQPLPGVAYGGLVNIHSESDCVPRAVATAHTLVSVSGSFHFVFPRPRVYCACRRLILL